MLSQNNISHVFVAEGTGLSAGAVSALSSGQIGVYQNGETTGDAGALTTGDKFQVFLKDLNGNLVNSPWIEYDNIRSSNAVNYTAPTEQKVYVGYNGTTGSITTTNSEVYTMHMNLQDGSSTWGEHPLFKMVAAYESDASATQTEIADALVVNAVKNFEREAAANVDYMKVGRINSATVTAANGFKNAQDVTVVNGSKVIVCDTDVTYEAAGGSTLVVGDYVRIGGVGAGTALTSSVYKVTAISGVNVTLDIPVIEASGTYTAVDGTSDIEVIPSATAIAADWGLSFEAKPLPFEPGMKKYKKLVFDLQLGDGFGNTLTTEDTGPSKGEGSYMEVAENEWLLNGNRGEPYRVASYPVSNKLGADSAETYDAVVVHFTNNNSIQIDHEVKSYISLIFYVVTDTPGTSGSTAYTNLKTVFGL